MLGALACAALVAGATAYSFEFMSFLHAKEAVLCAALLACALAGGFGGVPRRNSVSFLFPLAVWVFASLLRTAVLPVAVMPDAFAESFRWLLLLALTLLLHVPATLPPWRERIQGAFVASGVVVAVLGLVQYAGLAPSLFPVFEGYTQRVYSVFGNQDLFGGYIAMALPVAAWIGLRRTSGPWPGLAAVVVMTTALGISGSRSAWLAAAVGTGVVLAFGRPFSGRIKYFAMGLVLAVGATTALAPDATVLRVRQTVHGPDEGREARTWLWCSAWDMFADSPLLGVGMGQYRYWSPSYLGDRLRESPNPQPFDVERHADQPHSEPLRLLAETGLLGLFCWVWLLWKLRRARGPEWGPLAAFGVFALFNGPFDSVAHMLPVLLLMASLAERGDPRGAALRRRLNRSWGLALAVVAFECWTILVPSYMLRQAEDAQLAGADAESEYARVLAWPWRNARAWKNLGIALADAGRDEEAYQAFLRAREGLDTGDIYLALAALAVQRNDPAAARHWAEECLRRWPGNEEAGQILLRVRRAGPR